jgi:hypothetical protein
MILKRIVVGDMMREGIGFTVMMKVKVYIEDLQESDKLGGLKNA